MKHVQTQAIVLKRMHYGEADRILTVITPDNGKVSLIAKGVRRSKSKLAGGLELFSVTNLTFIDGRSELKTVVSTRLDSFFKHIIMNVSTTMLAYEFMKLVDENTQEQSDSNFYYLLKHALESLDVGEDVQLTKAWFFVQIMRHSGRGMNLDKQVSGKVFSEDAKYAFDIDNMGFVAQEQGNFRPKHIKFLRLLSKVDSPGHVLRVRNAGKLAAELTHILEHAAKYV